MTNTTTPKRQTPRLVIALSTAAVALAVAVNVVHPALLQPAIDATPVSYSAPAYAAHVGCLHQWGPSTTALQRCEVR